MPTQNASSLERRAWPPALALCGWSGSGKTTLIEGLLDALVSDGLKTAVVKHAFHPLDIEAGVKDGARFFAAGADAFAHDDAKGIVLCRRSGLGQRLLRFGRDYDLVLVEGHKGSDLEKVWLSGDTEESPPENVRRVRAVLTGRERTVRRLRRVVDNFLLERHRALPVWAAVLVGGAGRRMGQPKSGLRIGDEPLLARITRVAAACAEGVVLVGKGPVPEECAERLRLPDAPGVEGPLAGLLSAMRWQPDARWLALACDLPFVNERAIRWLLDRCGPGRPAVAPHREDPGLTEPLFAVYDPPAASLLEAGARGGERSLRRILASSRVFSPRIPADLQRAWTNVNTPADLREATA